MVRKKPRRASSRAFSPRRENGLKPKPASLAGRQRHNGLAEVRLSIVMPPSPAVPGVLRSDVLTCEAL